MKNCQARDSRETLHGECTTNGPPYAVSVSICRMWIFVWHPAPLHMPRQTRSWLKGSHAWQTRFQQAWLCLDLWRFYLDIGSSLHEQKNIERMYSSVGCRSAACSRSKYFQGSKENPVWPHFYAFSWQCLEDTGLWSGWNGWLLMGSFLALSMALLMAVMSCVLVPAAIYCIQEKSMSQPCQCAVF